MKTKLVVLAIAAASTLGALFWYGAYDISATDQHLAPTYWLVDLGMRRAVVQRAKWIAVPPLDDAEQVALGAARFRQHCVQCHGAPGVAPELFALGMTPAPANLAYTARAWRPAELFWAIKQGIKMTGMPAWEFRMPEEDLWATVAFLKRLPLLSVEEYHALRAPPTLPRWNDFDGTPDPRRGKQALEQYGCIGCHEIPGLVGPEARLGPPLAGIGARTMLGGVLPNSSENMVLWLRAPQAFSRHSAMPMLGATERDARDMAAYLGSLK